MFVYPDSITTFEGNKDFALAAGFIEVEDSIYNDLLETKKIWQDGEIVDDPTYEERKRQEIEEQEREREIHEIINEINDLKQKLAESDYKAIKYFEGWITDEEYELIKTERQAWRNRINELEKII